MNKIAQSVLVSYTLGDDENSSLMLVGQKQPGKDIVIVNALQGKEANELWNKLITKKEKQNAGKES